MPSTSSPLRYPGGKTKLTPFLEEIIFKNKLFDGHYIEPYAGGSGLAIQLLLNGYARYIHLNDLDKSIYAFWHTLLNETGELYRYIDQVDITMDEWENQKAVQLNKKNESMLSLGISTFFLIERTDLGLYPVGSLEGRIKLESIKLMPDSIETH